MLEDTQFQIIKKIDVWQNAIMEEDGSLFREEPVTLDEFLFGSGYLNISKLSDIQKEFVQYGTQIYFEKELNYLQWQKVRRVSELVAFWGKGSGKDMCSEIIQSRIAYQLLCLRNPQQYFNQLATSNIDMLNMAYNEEQASQVFFKQFISMIRNCRWFTDKCHVGSNYVQFDKKICAYSGHSFEESFEGKNLIVCVLDEISAFKTKMEV